MRRSKGVKTMLRISQLKLQCHHSREELLGRIACVLRIRESEILELQIVKQSIDARKKPEIFYVYTVDVKVTNEKKALSHHRPNVTKATTQPYRFPECGSEKMTHRPVVVGSGPAGLFCAYMLAEHGYRPILLERGASVEERKREVETFWQTGKLNLSTNVQFGEGGAGTFSDGKLNTMVRDPLGRNRKVLEVFVENGAPKEILYVNKPHIGTDLLMQVVREMRRKIIAWGGKVHFHTCLSELLTEGQRVTGIRAVTESGDTVTFCTEHLVLAIGHSARDTFEMLHRQNVPMEAKAFAVGVRMEHPQAFINRAQYGREDADGLPAASYKVTSNLADGRGVYSFCMCPGGYVVNASSEEKRLAVNGMSYHARDSKNANSAIIVTVTPKDFGTQSPLAGMYFQRELEERAYSLADGAIPVQRFADFCLHRVSDSFGEVTPCMKGNYAFADVRSIFPETIGDALECGIREFDSLIRGFAMDDALLSGVESRTSSPIRMPRDDKFQSVVAGLYPCGEGAGYAGGITSAAMDGIKVAEILAKNYSPLD